MNNCEHESFFGNYPMNTKSAPYSLVDEKEGTLPWIAKMSLCEFILFQVSNDYENTYQRNLKYLLNLLSENTVGIKDIHIRYILYKTGMSFDYSNSILDLIYNIIDKSKKLKQDLLSNDISIEDYKIKLDLFDRELISIFYDINCV
mgnify:CR=1 FL=1